LQLYTEPYDPDLDEKRIRIPGRDRRGSEPISYCDLLRVAWFYGVTPSMAAGVLRNLRYITKDQFERLDQISETASALPLKDALALPDHHVESGRDAFRSRLLALSIECLNQGLITHDDFNENASLVDLRQDQRQVLLAQVSTEMLHTSGQLIAEDRM